MGAFSFGAKIFIVVIFFNLLQIQRLLKRNWQNF